MQVEIWIVTFHMPVWRCVPENRAASFLRPGGIALVSLAEYCAEYCSVKVYGLRAGGTQELLYLAQSTGHRNFAEAPRA